MKKKMRYFVVFLFLLSNMIYSQEFPSYLESDDIGIYIKGASRVMEIIWERLDVSYENIDISNKNIENYFLLISHQMDVMAIGRAYYLIVPDDEDGGLLRNLINCNVPEDIKKLFRSIGWENNGHKKFWTIYFYIHYLQIMEEHNNPDSEPRHRMREFDEWAGNFDGTAEESLVNQHGIRYPRIIEILNTHDLELIISHWDVLVSGGGV